MFNHSCCCDQANPNICDPFEDACGTSVLFRSTPCRAKVDFEEICPRWCSGGVDIGPLQMKSSRSVEVDFHDTPLTRVDQGNTRFFRGNGFATVEMGITGRYAREEWEDCQGGQTILQCSPFQHSYTHTVTTQILISCAQELGTLAQFVTNPCVVPPTTNDVGYLVLYASSCFKQDPLSRFYFDYPTIGPTPSRYICDSLDAYLNAPRSAWAWYAYYRKGDCILRQPPLVWRPLAGGFSNWQPSTSTFGQPCVPLAGSFFTAAESDFAVRTSPTCDFDWERNVSWSSIFPGSCEPTPFATYGPVASCNAVKSGYCQQTEVFMGIPGIT